MRGYDCEKKEKKNTYRRNDQITCKPQSFPSFLLFSPNYFAVDNPPSVCIRLSGQVVAGYGYQLWEPKVDVVSILKVQANLSLPPNKRKVALEFSWLLMTNHPFWIVVTPHFVQTQNHLHKIQCKGWLNQHHFINGAGRHKAEIWISEAAKTF